VADGAGRDFPGLFQISPGKVDPIYYGKAYKVKLILVAKFIASAHCSLKIEQNPCKTSHIISSLPGLVTSHTFRSKSRVAFAPLAGPADSREDGDASPSPP